MFVKNRKVNQTRMVSLVWHAVLGFSKTERVFSVASLCLLN